MLKDLLEESLKTQLYKVILKIGLLKLKLMKKINPSSVLNIKINLKNSILKKFLPWSYNIWKVLLKIIYLNPLHKLLLLFQLISMILKDKLQKMPELFLDLMYSESSMNLLLLPSLMVLLKKIKEAKISLSSL